MTTVLSIHVKMAPFVSRSQITSLVPVHQNTREHCVKHVIFAMVKTVQVTGLVIMIEMNICVSVTLGLRAKIVKDVCQVS